MVLSPPKLTLYIGHIPPQCQWIVKSLGGPRSPKPIFGDYFVTLTGSRGGPKIFCLLVLRMPYALQGTILQKYGGGLFQMIIKTQNVSL